MAKQTVASTNERVDELQGRIEALEALLLQTQEQAQEQPTQKSGVKCGKCTKKAKEARYHANRDEVRHCYMN